METKVCKKCGIEKNLDEFRLNRKKCRQCERDYSKEYRNKNHELCLKNNRKWRENNREKIREYNKNYRKTIDCSKYELTPERKAYRKEYMKTWKNTHKEQINEYKRNYYYNNKNDLLYVFKIRTRLLIQKAFKRKGYKKTSKTQEILGCNYKTFIEHLLQTFKDNYGYEWNTIEKVHIDHIIPLSTAKTKEEVLRLNDYRNLQLLKELDNLHKSDKLNWSIKE